MNNYCFLFIIVIIFNYFIGVYSENANYIVSILRKKSDINFDDESPETQLEIEKLVNDRMNDIYDTIEENKESYILENGEQDKKLEELETNPLRKRGEKVTKYLFLNSRIKNNHFKRSIELSNFNSTDSDIEYIPIKSKLINHICPIKNYYAINVYLSEQTAKIVCNLNNVLYCEKSDTYQLHDIIHKENFDYRIIKNKNNMTDISEQYINFYPDHLTVLSHEDNKLKGREHIFRYPVSAGKGIDIYIIDTGIIINHIDFDTYEGTEDERTITCDAIIDSDEIRLTDEYEKNVVCYGKFEKGDDSYQNPYHGIKVASVAAGSMHGVAKKANIHALATDLSIIGTLRAFDYISQIGKPHKTVINLSFGNKTFYRKSDDDKLTELINKGFIIVNSAGNENKNCCAPKDSKDFHAFSGYRKTINVGAATPYSKSEGYYMEYYSNFGDCVDIFAPGYVSAALISYPDKDRSIESEGTSFSSPLVAGVAASIMSENPDYKFDTDSMKNVLIELSIKSTIDNLGSDDTPNRFINNGKMNLISSLEIECGIESPNNSTCSNGCCTKEGKCISFLDNPGEKCLIENDCQKDFGFCITKELAITECENKLKRYESCQIEISDELNDDDLLKCSFMKKNSCFQFYEDINNYGSFSNFNECSIARNFKDFGFINTMDIPKYHHYSNICYRNIYKKYTDKCIEEVSSYRKCLIDDNILNIVKSDIKDINELDKNLISTLQKNCFEFKAEECYDFRSRPEEIILTYHTCSLLKQYSYLDIFSREIFLSEKNDKKFLDFCERIYENQGPMCQNRLKEFDECLPIFTNSTTNEEIIENCSRVNSDKCQLFYENKDKSIQVCNSYIQDYEKIELLNNMEETINNYINICKNNIDDEIKGKVISQCKNELQDSECLFDYHPDMTDTEISQHCEIYKSEKCQEKYLNSSENLSICKLAKLYSNDEIESLINHNNEKKLLNNHLCYHDKEDIIEKCNKILDINNYDLCIFKEEKTPDRIYYNCLLFTEEFCQNFYEDPYKNIPECIVAERYQQYNIFSKSDKRWNDYNEKCPSIIKAGINGIMEINSNISSTIIEPTLIIDEPTSIDINDEFLIIDEPTLFNIDETTPFDIDEPTPFDIDEPTPFDIEETIPFDIDEPIIIDELTSTDIDSTMIITETTKTNVLYT